jgi:hypothetical protein
MRRANDSGMGGAHTAPYTVQYTTSWVDVEPWIGAGCRGVCVDEALVSPIALLCDGGGEGSSQWQRRHDGCRVLPSSRGRTARVSFVVVHRFVAEAALL